MGNKINTNLCLGGKYNASVPILDDGFEQYLHQVIQNLRKIHLNNRKNFQLDKNGRLKVYIEDLPKLIKGEVCFDEEQVEVLKNYFNNYKY